MESRWREGNFAYIRVAVHTLKHLDCFRLYNRTVVRYK